MILNNLSMLFLPINVILIIIFTIIVYLIPRNTERNKLISNILLVLNFYLIIIFLMCFLEITINLEKIYFLNFRNDMEIDLETMLEFKINCIQFNSIDIRNEKILNLYKNFAKLEPRLSFSVCSSGKNFYHDFDIFTNKSRVFVFVNLVYIFFYIGVALKNPCKTDEDFFILRFVYILIFYLILLFLMNFFGISIMITYNII